MAPKLLRKKATKHVKPKVTLKRNLAAHPFRVSHDDIISSDDDEGADQCNDNAETDFISESVEEKRLRLGKQYLSHLEKDNGDDGRISSELESRRLKESGSLFVDLSETYRSENFHNIAQLKMSDHRGAVTSVAVTSDESSVFSASKDNAIIQWNIETGTRHFIKRAWCRSVDGNVQCSDGEILALTLSSDDRYLAAGGRDRVIRIYDHRLKYSEIHSFSGHRDSITALAFQRGNHSLFSGSNDRCLKHWSLDEMGYIETLFGHQDFVCSLDCWTKARPLSSSNDRSLRVWKVAEETHSVFRGHKACIDSSQFLTDNTFISAGQDGQLALWKDTQKGPVRMVPAAHGFMPGRSNTNPNWVTSLASVKMSNVCASGSCDGFVRLWKADADDRVLSPLGALPVAGFVNALAITPHLVVAGCGREPRLGRWQTIRGNHNQVVLYRIPESA